MESKWFVAYVRSCQERVVARQLAAMGVEHYYPVRKELRQWSDRKVLKERLLMPGIIFIHCTEQERYHLLTTVTYLTRFMMDRLSRTPVCVPPIQLLNFRRFIDGADTPVQMHSSDDFKEGDRVRVISGPLMGTECYVTKIKNRLHLYVRLDLLGSAVTEIGVNQIEAVNGTEG